jgi:hypothetical protein
MTTLICISPYAHASDFSRLIVLYTIPLMFFSFVISMLLAYNAKTKNSEIGLFFINIPNWLGVFFTISTGFTAGSVFLLVIGAIGILLSIIPFRYLKNRLEKRNVT